MKLPHALLSIIAHIQDQGMAVNRENIDATVDKLGAYMSTSHDIFIVDDVKSAALAQVKEMEIKIRRIIRSTPDNQPIIIPKDLMGPYLMAAAADIGMNMIANRFMEKKLEKLNPSSDEPDVLPANPRLKDGTEGG
jgi:hypothetical protein